VQQTTQANKRRLEAPFKEGDLVYLSTKNLKIPKERVRKLVPKYIGPFKIIQVVVPGATFKLELPPDMVKRRIYDTFHADLLRPHVENDDQRFPGRTWEHITYVPLEGVNNVIEEILGYKKIGDKFIFYALWSDKHITEEPLESVSDSTAFADYCEAKGFSPSRKFGVKMTHAENVVEEIPVTGIRLEVSYDSPKFQELGIKDEENGQLDSMSTSTDYYNNYSTMMSFNRPTGMSDLSYYGCSLWARSIADPIAGKAGFPGRAPPDYEAFYAVNKDRVTSSADGNAAIIADAIARRFRDEENDRAEQRKRERVATEEQSVPMSAMRMFLETQARAERQHAYAMMAAQNRVPEMRYPPERRDFGRPVENRPFRPYSDPSERPRHQAPMYNQRQGRPMFARKENQPDFPRTTHHAPKERAWSNQSLRRRVLQR
jgi:hypothetical protein